MNLSEDWDFPHKTEQQQNSLFASGQYNSVALSSVVISPYIFQIWGKPLCDPSPRDATADQTLRRGVEKRQAAELQDDIAKHVDVAVSVKWRLWHPTKGYKDAGSHEERCW